MLDNASTDDSVAWLQAHHPHIRIIQNERNDGFAIGNNKALAEITTPYALLLNSDVACTPGWLAPLVELAEANPDVAAIMPKIRAHRQPTHFEYAGAAGGWIDRYGFPFCRGRIFEVVEEDKGQYEDVTEVFWTTGACMLVRMEVVRKIGLFDERYFAHMEEIDFCWRAQNHGYRLLVQPASTVYHVGGATLAMNHPRKAFYNVRNSLMTVTKNAPKGRVLKVLLLRWLIDSAAAWAELLLKGRWRFFLAVLRAHLSYVAHLPYCIGQRHHKPKKPIRALKGLYQRSVVWQYYFRKITRFTDLP